MLMQCHVNLRDPAPGISVHNVILPEDFIDVDLVTEMQGLVSSTYVGRSTFLPCTLDSSDDGPPYPNE